MTDQLTKRCPNLQEEVIIGSLLFLRFICPAIISPDQYELVSERPSPEARRCLILVSKILQLISNDLSEMDDPIVETFIRENMDKMRECVRKLTQNSPPNIRIEGIDLLNIPTLASTNSMETQYVTIVKNLLEVQKEAISALSKPELTEHRLKLEEILKSAEQSIDSKNKKVKDRSSSPFRKSISKVFFPETDSARQEKTLKKISKSSTRLSIVPPALLMENTKPVYENPLMDSNGSDFSLNTPQHDARTTFMSQINDAVDELMLRLNEKDEVINTLQCDKKKLQLLLMQTQPTTTPPPQWMEEHRLALEAISHLKRENKELNSEVKRLSKQLGERNAKPKYDERKLRTSKDLSSSPARSRIALDSAATRAIRNRTTTFRKATRHSYPSKMTRISRDWRKTT